MLHRFGLLPILMALSLQMALGQGFILPEGKESEKIRFELVNNLMVVPVEINGAELKFVLDTGVSSPILFNLMD